MTGLQDTVLLETGLLEPGLAAAITASGQSRRFGSDKALYVLSGRTLLEHVAASLHGCAPRLLIAPPGRYRLPGWRAVPDRRPGLGPLAGLETALYALSAADAGGWLAFSAVDLPHLSPAYWALLAERRAANLQAVLGLDDAGRPQPLAALYHVSALPAASRLLEGGQLRMTALLSGLSVGTVPWAQVGAAGQDVYTNLNVPPG